MLSDAITAAPDSRVQGEASDADAGHDIAIRLSGVSKAYHIFARPEDRLKQMLFGRWKTYHRDFLALADIDLTIRTGEAVALVGRNGAGKSTLLQVVTSILQPTTGSVEVNGRIAPLLQLGTSFNPEFTGVENIDLSASILGLSSDEIEAARDQIIAFAELDDFIHQPVRTYSSGMFARLAFAVAAHVRADILIVDEVLSVGDIGFTQKCTRFLRDFRERGTLLFVSHDVGAVLSLCDRAVWIDHGRIIEDAEPKRIIPHYAAWIANPDRGDPLTYVRNVRERTVPDPASEDAGTGLTGDASPPKAAVVAAPAPLIGRAASSAAFQAFDWDARALGTLAGRIVDAWWETAQGERVNQINGGDEVVLNVAAVMEQDVVNPIIGFSVKDRFGQIVFAWDTSKEFRQGPSLAPAGARLHARFTMPFPILAGGYYSVSFGLSSGTADAFEVTHRVFDALAFNVVASRFAQGMIGVVIEDFSLAVLDHAGTERIEG